MSLEGFLGSSHVGSEQLWASKYLRCLCPGDVSQGLNGMSIDNELVGFEHRYRTSLIIRRGKKLLDQSPSDQRPGAIMDADQVVFGSQCAETGHLALGSCFSPWHHQNVESELFDHADEVMSADHDALIDTVPHSPDSVGDHRGALQLDHELVSSEPCACSAGDDNHRAFRHVCEGTFARVIEVSELRAALDDGSSWVFVDHRGHILDMQNPGGIGPATMLVVPVDEALKRIDGDTITSIDREGAWAVTGFALNRVVIDRLEPGSLTPTELHDIIVAIGLSWQFYSITP